MKAKEKRNPSKRRFAMTRSSSDNRSHDGTAELDGEEDLNDGDKRYRGSINTITSTDSTSGSSRQHSTDQNPRHNVQGHPLYISGLPRATNEEAE
jgi:hypothetical protein